MADKSVGSAEASGRSMSSRERVLATLAGQPVDRIASDFRAEKEVFEKLQRHLGLPDEESVRRWAKSDFRDLGFICNTGGYGGYNSFGWKDAVREGGILEDLWGVQRKKVLYDGGTYIDIIRHPLKAAQGLDDLRKYVFPDPRKIFDFSDLPDAVAAVNREEERFILIEGESLFDRCWALRGIQEFMMDLLTDEDAALHLIEQHARFFYEYTRMLLEKAKGRVDAIGIYNDLGSQNGMMIAPETYRKFLKEPQRRFIQMVKEHGARIFYHSCGGITAVVEDLIEIGVDILDPLQFPAMRISPARLMEMCGGRITLHGGVDTQFLLSHGTPGEVRGEIQSLKRILGQGGRYIVSCSHLLQVDVPLANIEAIVAEVN